MIEQLVLGAVVSALVKKGVVGAESLLSKHSSRKKLEKAIQNADNEFRKAAEEQGLGDTAALVLQLPLKDKQSMNYITEAVLAARNCDEINDLTMELLSKVRNIGDRDRLKAAALYAEKLHDALWDISDFHDVIARWERQEQTDLLKQILSLLQTHIPTWDAWKVLTWPEKEEPTGPVNLRLLRAQKRLIPFVVKSREKERDDLVEWAESLYENGMVGIRIYIGKGGSGKTRLVIEAGDLLQEKGWETWFVDTAEFIENWWADEWIKKPEPLFLVIDYANAKNVIVERVLRAAAKFGRGRLKPLAILLLDREYTCKLKSLMEDRTGFRGEAWASFRALDLAKVKQVEPLKPKERLKLFTEARRKFAAMTGQRESGIDYAPDDLPKNPLALILLALLAANGHKVVQSEDEVQVFEDVWNRWERMKWKHIVESEGVCIHPYGYEKALELIEVALLATTLGRSFQSYHDVAVFWETNFVPLASSSSLFQLAQCMPNLFPIQSVNGNWRLEPVVPDPLSDWLVTKKLTDQESPTEYIKKLLCGMADENFVKAALILHRCLASPGIAVEDRALLREACKWVDLNLPQDSQSYLVSNLEKQAYESDSSTRHLVLQSIRFMYDSNIPVKKYIRDKNAFGTIVQNAYREGSITQSDYERLQPLETSEEGEA